MTKIHDLDGFSYPTPEGTSAVVGDLPWHFGTENLNIVYRTDPDVVASYLPDPLEPGDNPGRVIVSFSKWWSLWDNQTDMPTINPERTWYTETVVWVSSSYKGEQGKTCIHTWVDNDFTMARGMFLGFPKKIGKTHKTDYNPMNPEMPSLGPGEELMGYTTAHGERLMEGKMKIEEEIPYEDLPAPTSKPLFNIRYFPSIEKGAEPSVCELVRINAENARHGKVWSGSGDIKLYPSDIEEYSNLEVKDVVGAYYFDNGVSITGGEVLHSWV
jgi:acetoacetate decarboxylase